MASQRECSLAFAVVTAHEFVCARPRACCLALAAALCHALCCLRPLCLGFPSSSHSSIESSVSPGSSSAVNRRPFADLLSPIFLASPIFRVAFRYERI
jgi:hypothetical protein